MIIQNNQSIYATGKRKTAIARLWIRERSEEESLSQEITDEKRDFFFTLDDLKKNDCKLQVNDRDVFQYFCRPDHIMDLFRPLMLLSCKGYKIFSTVHGGGKSAQAEALRLALSRALTNDNVRSILKREGLLTRDSRRVERKHYGHVKARKSAPYNRR